MKQINKWKIICDVCIILSLTAFVIDIICICKLGASTIPWWIYIFKIFYDISVSCWFLKEKLRDIIK